MISFSFKFRQFCAKVLAYVVKDCAQRLEDGFRKHVTPVFGDKDQVHVHEKNAASPSS